MNKIIDLEKRIIEIEKRNARVESDKAWETSWVRRILLILYTYFAIGLYMQLISVPNPWLNAFIPSVGFYLSTLTLPLFKSWWLRARHR